MASDFYLIIFKGNSPSNTLIKRQFNDESKIKILNTFVFLIQIKYWLFRLEFTKCFSEKQTVLFVLAFLAGN